MDRWFARQSDRSETIFFFRCQNSAGWTGSFSQDKGSSIAPVAFNRNTYAPGWVGEDFKDKTFLKGSLSFNKNAKSPTVQGLSHDWHRIDGDFESSIDTSDDMCSVNKKNKEVTFAPSGNVEKS